MIKTRLLLTICALLILMLAQAQFPIQVLNTDKRIFNIKDFGAVGDSVTLDTKAIQSAIDACTSSGGGLVWVPAGDYIMGTIQLKSNVTLSLDYGASLLGSLNIADYDTTITKPREGNVECLIFAENATNITIEGLGTIDGRGTHIAFPRGPARGERNPRPRLIRMENCNQLRFAGVTFKRPAFWGIHLIDCTNIHFDAITVRFRNNNYNNDGLDLDGCQNVLIENSDIVAGDDAICLKSSLNPCRNYTIRNCRVASNTSPLKFGTSSFGGFIDINVTNCYFYDSPMGAIKLELVDGGKMENINISRITMEDVGNPIFIRLGGRGNSYLKGVDMHGYANVLGGKDGIPPGTIKNIRISDLKAKVTVETFEQASRAVYKGLQESKWGKKDDLMSKAGPIMITGIPGHYIEDVVLENVEISYPGGGTKEHTKNEVAEDILRYPEQFFFGVLPAWGAYIRHAKNIEFKNVKMTLRSDDKREMIVLDDVEGFVND
ncbi:MAG: glycoside hydrolase family 28 protein [Cyclobacteriaceae bacterium]